VGFNSLTTNTHPPNFILPPSGQQDTARLSARKVSVAGGNRVQEPLVRDTARKRRKRKYRRGDRGKKIKKGRKRRRRRIRRYRRGKGTKYEYGTLVE